MKGTFFTFLVLGLLASCSPKTTVTDVSEPETMDFPNEITASGYSLYTSRCGRCHKLKTVDNYSQDQWDGILPRMAAKAKLEGEQETTIGEYIKWELNN